MHTRVDAQLCLVDINSSLFPSYYSWDLQSPQNSSGNTNK